MPRPADNLQAILTLGSLGALDDATLLDLFESPGAVAADRAFEVLIRRHGPLVLRVARGRLDLEEDARDAFQATFWLLARRSRSIRNRAALAGWLFGVASRVAARSVVESARRRTRERRVALSEADSTTDPARRDPDLASTIQAEVARLPRLYRVAVILCDLEGLSYEEAAHRLDCPLGTFKARLSRGRSRLRDRLARRGLAPLGWESTPSHSPVVPLALIQTTCRLVLNRTSAGGAAMLATESVVSLAQGVSKSMFFTTGKFYVSLAATIMIAAVMPTLGSVFAVDPDPASGPGSPPAAPEQQGSATPAVEPAPWLSSALHQATALTETITEPIFRARFLLELGRLQTRVGTRTAARATLEQARTVAEVKSLERDGYYPRLNGEVAQAQAQNGDVASIPPIFDHAAAVIAGFPVDRQEYHWTWLFHEARAVLPREASRPLIEVYRRFIGGERPDPKGFGWHISSWGGIAGCRGNYPAAKLVATRAFLGDFDGALNEIATAAVFHDPAQPGIQLQALVRVAQNLRPTDGPAIARTLDRIHQVFDPAAPSNQLGRHLLILMDVATRLGRFDEAIATEAKILAAEDPDEPSVRELVVGIGQLALAQAAVGDKIGARDSIGRALAATPRMNSKEREEAIAKLASVAGRVGDLELAFELAESLALGERFFALEQIQQACLADRRTDDALLARERMTIVARRALRLRIQDSLPGVQSNLTFWTIQVASTSGLSADFDAARQSVTSLPPEPSADFLMGRLALAQAESGSFAAALATVDRLTAEERGFVLLKVIEIELNRETPN